MKFLALFILCSILSVWVMTYNGDDILKAMSKTVPEVDIVKENSYFSEYSF